MTDFGSYIEKINYVSFNDFCNVNHGHQTALQGLLILDVKNISFALLWNQGHFKISSFFLFNEN